MKNLLLLLRNSNHLRATATFQFSTNYARKYRFRILLGRPKKSENLFSDFLFKPQAWYVITRKRVWHCRRRMASLKVH